MPLNQAFNRPGTPFIELQSVDSTNKYAMALIHEGMAQHGTVLYAHEQTAGKGQRGRSWLSEKGKSLTFSIIISPGEIPLNNQFLLSAATALGVMDFFSIYLTQKAKIKWPNDIYLDDRKAGGILIENVLSVGGKDLKEEIQGKQLTGDPKWKWAVIGIGININQTIFSEEITRAISLKMVTGNSYDPMKLYKELIVHIGNRLILAYEGDHEQLMEKYNRYLFKKDQIAKLRKDNRVFETLVLGVDRYGQLITRHAVEEKFSFGEVSWETD